MTNGLLKETELVPLTDVIESAGVDLGEGALVQFVNCFVQLLNSYTEDYYAYNSNLIESGQVLRGALALKSRFPKNNYDQVTKAISKIHGIPHHEQDIDIRTGPFKPINEKNILTIMRNIGLIHQKPLNNVTNISTFENGDLDITVTHLTLPPRRKQWLIKANDKSDNKSVEIDLSSWPIETAFLYDDRISATSTVVEMSSPLPITVSNSPFNVPAVNLEKDFSERLLTEPAKIRLEGNVSTVAGLLDNAIVWLIPFCTSEIGFHNNFEIGANQIPRFKRNITTFAEFDLPNFIVLGQDESLFRLIRLGDVLTERKTSISTLATASGVDIKRGLSDVYQYQSHRNGGLGRLHEGLVACNILPKNSQIIDMLEFFTPSKIVKVLSYNDVKKRNERRIQQLKKRNVYSRS